MRVIYHSRNKVLNAPEWCEYFENVEEMLAQADALSVHVPLRAETASLVGDKWIRALKKGAIIINTARGKVIDEDAMIRALEDGHVIDIRLYFLSMVLRYFCMQLGSVGLDVYPNEPEVNPRLLEFSHVVLLPHMGTETEDSRRNMEIRALGNLKDFLVKGEGTDLVCELK